MIELKINSIDASTLGIKMGDGFKDALFGPSPMKDYIENSSRLNNGVIIDTSNAKVDKRDVTLQFHLEGSSESDFNTKKSAFYTKLYAGNVTIEVPALSSEKFQLVYTGKSISYGENTAHTFCKISVKFTEANPMNR